jgi:hypothetical protein
LRDVINNIDYMDRLGRTAGEARGARDDIPDAPCGQGALDRGFSTRGKLAGGKVGQFHAKGMRYTLHASFAAFNGLAREA